MIMNVQNILKLFCVTLMVSWISTAVAEPAPVYDVDSMPYDGDPSTSEQDSSLPGQELGSISDQEVSSGVAERRPSPSHGSSVSHVETNIDMNRDAMSEDTSSMSMHQRVRRVEQILNNMQGNDMAAHLESLQNQVQTLRGELELVTHQLAEVQGLQKTLYADIDKRLAQANMGGMSKHPDTNATSTNPTSVLSSALKANNKPMVKSLAEATASTDLPGKSLADQPNVAEEQQIYQTAYNFIKAKKYSDAVTALQSMLKKYPSGQFASNAHYWLGELYGLMGKNDQSLKEFQAVVNNYTDSPRLSDAQLKVGLIYAAQFKWPDAKNAFKKVINHYPGTASARLASEQLKQIRQAGH